MKQKNNFFYFIASVLITFLCFQQQIVYANELNEQSIDSLQTVLLGAHNDTVRIQTLMHLSDACRKTDLVRSLEYAVQSMEFAEKKNNQALYAYTLFNAGNVYFALGMYEDASRVFFKYYELKRDEGNQQQIAFSLTNIGAIQLQMGQFDQAKPYFLNALGIISDLADEVNEGKPVPEMVSLYNNLGIIYRELGIPDTAILYYQLGIQIAKELKQTDETLAKLFNNLGNLYIDTEQFDRAFEALSTALVLRESINDLSGMAASHRNLGNYYTSVNNFQEAGIHFYKAVDYATGVGGKSLLQGIYNNMFEYYDVLGNADSALKYHILMKTYADEVNIEETLRELTILELSAQFSEKEKLIQAEQKRKELWYYFVAILLVLMLTLIAMLFILTKNRLKRIKLEKENSDFAAKNLALENDILEKKLEVQKKEMATQVLYQIKKNELVDRIVKKLLSHSTDFKKENQSLIRGIIRDLEQSQQDEVWDEFELRFQGVHNEFYEKLHQINPDLTTNERRLCAFLKLNMTTKEIASITGQSLRSIEVARTRLRRKLDLTNLEIGLTEYLSSL